MTNRGLKDATKDLCNRADNEVLQRLRADFMSGSVSGLDIIDLIETARIVERESIAVMLDKMAQELNDSMPALHGVKRMVRIATLVDAAAAVRARGRT